MRKIILILAFLLIFTGSAMAASTSPLIEDDILLVTEGYTFTIRFNKAVDKSLENQNKVKLRTIYGDLVAAEIINTIDANSIKIKLKDKMNLKDVYEVVVEAGIKSSENVSALSKTYTKRFVPDLNTSLNIANNNANASTTPNSYPKDAIDTYKGKIKEVEDIVKQGPLEDKEKLGLINYLRTAHVEFEDKKIITEKDGIFNLRLDPLSSKGQYEPKYTFSFDYVYNRQSFETELKGFQALLLRDGVLTSSAMIDKQQHAGIEHTYEPPYSIVHYNNIAVFNNYLDKNDIYPAKYSVRVRPIFLNGDSGPQSVSVVMLDKGRLQKPDVYFKNSFNMLVFNVSGLDYKNYVYRAYTSDAQKNIPIKASALTPTSDENSFIGTKFTPGSEKLVYELNATDKDILFGNTLGNYTLNVYATDPSSGDTDRKSFETSINIDFKGPLLPVITSVGATNIDAKTDYSKDSIKAIDVGNVEPLLVNTKNAVDGEIVIWKFSDSANKDNVIGEIRKHRYITVEDGKTGVDSYNRLISLIFPKNQEIVTSPYPDVYKITSDQVSIDKFVDNANYGEYLLMLRKGDLYFPLEGHYLSFSNKVPVGFEIGYFDGTSFIAFKEGESPKTNDDKAIGVSIKGDRRATVYLITADKVSAFKEAEGKEQFLEENKKDLLTFNANEAKKFDNTLDWRKTPKKYAVISKDDDGNFSEPMVFEIIDGNPPEVSDDFLIEVINIGEKGYLRTSYTSLTKDAVLFLVDSNKVKPDSSPTTADLEDNNILVKGINLTSSSTEKLESFDSEFDWLGILTIYNAYLVDANNNISEVIKIPVKSFEPADTAGVRIYGEDPETPLNVIQKVNGAYPKLNSAKLSGEPAVAYYKLIDETTEGNVYNNTPITAYGQTVQLKANSEIGDVTGKTHVRFYIVENGKVIAFTDLKIYQ